MEVYVMICLGCLCIAFTSADRKRATALGNFVNAVGWSFICCAAVMIIRSIFG